MHIAINMISKEELIALFHKDPSLGLKKAHDLYADSLFILSFRYVQDRQVAEEMVSDTFLRLYTHWHYFDTNRESEFYPWLSKLCINFCLIWLRKKKCPNQPVDQLESTLSFQLEMASDYEFLIQTIHRLSYPSNIIFLLYEVDGYQQSEISDQLGIPVGTIKSYLHRAKGHLRNILKPMGYGDQ